MKRFVMVMVCAIGLGAVAGCTNLMGFPVDGPLERADGRPWPAPTGTNEPAVLIHTEAAP